MNPSKPAGITIAFTPNAVMPSAARTLRNPYPSPSSSRDVNACVTAAMLLRPRQLPREGAAADRALGAFARSRPQRPIRRHEPEPLAGLPQARGLADQPLVRALAAAPDEAAALVELDPPGDALGG